MFARLRTPEAKLKDGMNLNRYVRPFPTELVEGIIFSTKNIIAIMHWMKLIKKAPTWAFP